MIIKGVFPWLGEGSHSKGGRRRGGCSLTCRGYIDQGQCVQCAERPDVAIVGDAPSAATLAGAAF